LADAARTLLDQPAASHRLAGRLAARWAGGGQCLCAYPGILGGWSGSALPAIGPTAQAIVRLAPAQLAAGLAVDAADALPLYVRDKVALTTLEREAAARAKHHA